MGYKFTSSANLNSFRLGDFLGVDLTNSESEVDQRRSPDMKNMILNQSGSLQKRFGLKKYDGTPATWIYSALADPQRRPRPVWDIMSFDIQVTVAGLITPKKVIFAFVSADVSPYKNGIFNIWYNYGANWTMLTGDYGFAKPIQVDNNSFVIVGDAYTRPTLCVFNNSGVITSYNLSDKTISGYENYIYTPKTNIGRSPSGLVTNLFEQNNILSQYQINTFLADGTSADYICSDTVNTADTKVWVKVAGVWVLKTVTTHYTIDTANKKITFTAGNIPAVPSVIGEDNVKIQFLNSNKDMNPLYQARTIGYYGFNNTKNYVFLSKLKKEYFMEKKLPLYIGIDNYTDFPSTVKGYAGYGEYQTVHCEREIFVRSSSLDAAGEVIFPVKPSVTGVGIVESKTLTNYSDNPIWVSEFGVTSLVSGALQYVTVPKGYYIFGENMNARSATLLRYYNSFAFVYGEKYYLYNEQDGIFYVADKRYQYSEKDTGGKSQFEWFKWEFKTKWAVENDQSVSDKFTGQCVDQFGRCLLSSTSGIYTLKNSSDIYPYTDERYDYNDYDVADTTPNWTNDTDYIYGQFRWYHIYGSDYPFMCIKDHSTTTAETILPTNETYWVRSISTTINIPIKAYLVTPVMNMGDPSVKKTLKNLWVRLEKYENTSVKVYYSTMGLVKQQYDGFFNFSNVDFSRFNFSTDTDPMVVVTNRSERKFMSIQFKVESDDQYPFGLLEIVGKYTINNQFRG